MSDQIRGGVRVPLGAKGLPLGAVGASLAGLSGWNALEGPLPAAVLRRKALDHNKSVMREFVERTGAKFAPHGKTTMAPHLFSEQLAAGAWGLTCATTAHLALYRGLGIQRIIYANQLVDPAAVTFILAELERDPGFEFYALVDSRAGVQLLEAEMERSHATRPLRLLVDVGAQHGRTGVRSSEEAFALARVVRDVPGLQICGVSMFEGIFSPDAEGTVDEKVERMVRLCAEIANGLADQRLLDTEVPVVSAGGSLFFEQVLHDLKVQIAFDAEFILRSGCYLTDDHGFYAKGRPSNTDGRGGPPRLRAPLQPALEVWAHVQSRPEPDVIFLTLGKRDISHDIDLPIPIWWMTGSAADTPRRALDGAFTVLRLNDQHAYVRVPADHEVAVGDRIGLGCSHPCTTFDKWRHLLIVDENYRVERVIETYF